jgi:single-strand DNA-binding protein
MSLNRVILFGRLVRDPETRQTQSGIAVCKFTVACDRQFKNQQTGERECDFIEVQAWRQAAEFVGRYFSKGDAITVEGSLRNNNFEDKNGVKHYGYVVMADNIGFGGGKSESGQQNNAPSGNYQQARQQAPQAAPAQDQGLNIANLGDFEEILSDGEVPF